MSPKFRLNLISTSIHREAPIIGQRDLNSWCVGSYVRPSSESINFYPFLTLCMLTSGRFLKSKLPQSVQFIGEIALYHPHLCHNTVTLKRITPNLY